MQKIIATILLFMFVMILGERGICFAAEDGTLYKLAKYQSECKNPTIAVLGAWIFPSVGHAYAGDWMRGAPFLALDVGFIALMSSSPSTFLSYAFTISRIWEYVDAYATAEDANSKLAIRLSVSDNILPLTSEDKQGEVPSVSTKEALQEKTPPPLQKEGEMDLKTKVETLEKKYDQQFKILFERLEINQKVID